MRKKKNNKNFYCVNNSDQRGQNYKDKTSSKLTPLDGALDSLTVNPGAPNNVSKRFNYSQFFLHNVYTFL